MVFNGMLVPVTVFGHGALIAIRFVPTTLGVEALNTTLAGRVLGAAWADGTLPWLLVHAAAPRRVRVSWWKWKTTSMWENSPSPRVASGSTAAGSRTCACRKPCPRHATRRYSLIRPPT
jgi:hypothetical protein